MHENIVRVLTVHSEQLTYFNYSRTAGCGAVSRKFTRQTLRAAVRGSSVQVYQKDFLLRHHNHQLCFSSIGNWHTTE